MSAPSPQMTRAAWILAAAALAACTRTCAMPQPLSMYCTACPTLSQTISDAETLARSRLSRGARCGWMELQRCRGGQAVTIGDGLVGITWHFDASGAMTGAQGYSDDGVTHPRYGSLQGGCELEREICEELAPKFVLSGAQLDVDTPLEVTAGDVRLSPGESSAQLPLGKASIRLQRGDARVLLSVELDPELRAHRVTLVEATGGDVTLLGDGGREDAPFAPGSTVTWDNTVPSFPLRLSAGGRADEARMWLSPRYQERAPGQTGGKSPAAHGY